MIARRGALSARTWRYSASESLVLSATATAPARSVPSHAAANSGVSRMSSSTRSPGRTPSAVSAAPARATRAASSA